MNEMSPKRKEAQYLTQKMRGAFQITFKVVLPHRQIKYPVDFDVNKKSET